jgi:hypothetical protein
MSAEDLGLLVAFLGVLVAVLTLVWQFGHAQRERDEKRRRELEEAADQAARNVQEVADRVTALEVKIDVFWAGLMKDAATILHHPHKEHMRRDELLEKLLAGELKAAEEKELQSLLESIIGTAESTGDHGEQIAASILLRLMDTKSA